MTISSKP